jgi:hypothetical protein
LLYKHDEEAGEDPSPLLHSILSSLLIFLLTRDKSPHLKTDIMKSIQKMKRTFNDLIDKETKENPDAERQEKFQNVNTRKISVNNDAVYRLCDNSKYLESIVLKEYWSTFMSDITSETHKQYNFDEGKFFELSAVDRLFVFQMLIEQILNKEHTKTFLKNKVTSAKLQKQSAIVAEEFNTTQRVPCRITSLGRDRFRQRYWFFQGYTGCIFVEKAEREGKDDFSNPSKVEYGILSTEKLLDKLMEWLDPNGIDESILKTKIRRKEKDIRRSMKHMERLIKQGDSEEIKAELARKRKDLELRAELLKNEENESGEEDNQEAEEETDDHSADEQEEPAAPEEDEDVQMEEEEEEVKKPYNTRRNPKRKNDDDDFEFTTPPSKSRSSKRKKSEKEPTSERRSKRIQKRKTPIDESATPLKKRARTSSSATTSTPTTTSSSKKNNNGRNKKATAVVKKESTPSKAKKDPVKKEPGTRVKKETNGKQSPPPAKEKKESLEPVMLSANSHKYFVNMYDFAYLLSVEEERAKEQQEVSAEQNNVSPNVQLKTESEVKQEKQEEVMND